MPALFGRGLERDQAIGADHNQACGSSAVNSSLEASVILGAFTFCLWKAAPTKLFPVREVSN